MGTNPFADNLRAFEDLEETTRERRALLHAEREEIAIELLRDGHTVRAINEWLGTSNPNWIYTACASRGLGTPGQVRASGLKDASRPSLVYGRSPGGYRVTVTRTDESAVFTWDVEAGAYVPSEVNVSRGSELYHVVRKFGRGLLPFPYTTETP